MRTESLTRLSGKVEKGWGHELIWATTEKYCGKLMVFTKENAKTSMHFHREKDEMWYVNYGKFKVRYIDTTDCNIYEVQLHKGDTWHNPPLMPHQLVCLEAESSITEVSTPDSVEDNYRIEPGDSQNQQVKKK